MKRGETIRYGFRKDLLAAAKSFRSASRLIAVSMSPRQSGKPELLDV